LQRIAMPRWYSKSKAPASWKPRRLQSTFEGVDDPVLPGAGLPVLGLALRDPLGALGAAQMRHHRGFAQQSLEQRQIAVAPRFDPGRGVIAGHRSWSVPPPLER
jgi:hypothetical protein